MENNRTKKTKAKKSFMNKTITILQHEVSYFYQNDQDMPTCEQTHVQEMIIEGYNQGELNDPNECRGWWHIVRK